MSWHDSVGWSHWKSMTSPCWWPPCISSQPMLAGPTSSCTTPSDRHCTIYQNHELWLKLCFFSFNICFGTSFFPKFDTFIQFQINVLHSVLFGVVFYQVIIRPGNELLYNQCTVYYIMYSVQEELSAVEISSHVHEWGNCSRSYGQIFEVGKLCYV